MGGLIRPPPDDALAGADSAPQAPVEGAEPARAEPAPATPVGGPIWRVGGPIRPAKQTEQVLPLPPSPGVVVDRRVADQIARRKDAIARLFKLGFGHANPIREQQLVDGALEHGASVEDLERLAVAAQGRVDRFWHWVGDVHRWRDVLEDTDLAARERRARRAPSERSADRGPIRLVEAAPELSPRPHGAAAA